MFLFFTPYAPKSICWVDTRIGQIGYQGKKQKLGIRPQRNSQKKNFNSTIHFQDEGMSLYPRLVVLMLPIPELSDGLFVHNNSKSSRKRTHAFNFLCAVYIKTL